MLQNNLENNENSKPLNSDIKTENFDSNSISINQGIDFSVQQNQNNVNAISPIPEIPTNITNNVGLSEKEIFELEMKQFLESDVPSTNLIKAETHTPEIHKQELIKQAPVSPINVQSVPEETIIPSVFEQEANTKHDAIEKVNEVQPIVSNQASLNNSTTLNQPNQTIENQLPRSEIPVVGVGVGVETAQNNDVNFFEYDFANETKNQLAPVETEVKVADELLQFDFDSVIRDQSSKEVIPVDNRIELNKLLEPKENLIKKPGEANPNDNNVINISEDNGKHHRRRKAFMKASLYAFYVFLVFFVSVFAYTIYQQKTSFSLNRNEISLAINSTYQAEIIMDAAIQDSSNYEWSSSDTTIATVSDEGIVTAISTGSTIITVKSKKTRKTNELFVTAISILVDSIRFNRSSLSLTVDESTTLSPIINDDNAIIIDLTWESSNNNIVTVDSNGKITAVGAGTATVIAIEEVSGLAAEIEIKVNPKKNSSNNSNNNPKTNEKIAVTGISFNQSNANIKVGNTINVSATIRPANATNKKISWSSSNTKVATVSNGTIKAVGVGTATITAKTADGSKTATIKITVTEAPAATVSVINVSLSKNDISLETGDTFTLIPTVIPNNATNKEITWSSSDTSVATVNNSGQITAIGAGTATITVKTVDGGKTANCTVTVTNPKPATVAVTGVSLNKNSLNLEIGDEERLTATVNPGNATNKEVSWSSSDTSIATVSRYGRVTAIGTGTVTITVKTADGGKTATCTVTVTDSSDENPDNG